MKKEFTILWPDREESADAVIKKWVERQTDKRYLTVVSSDREIRTFARLNRARLLDCKEFHKLLAATLKEYKESKSLDKQDTDLSPLELVHWLEIFGATDE
jgi:hypothetical protein